MIDINAAVKLTGLTRALIYRLANLGQLPEPISPTKWLWDDSQAEEFVKACANRPAIGRPRKQKPKSQNSKTKGKK